MSDPTRRVFLLGSAAITAIAAIPVRLATATVADPWVPKSFSCDLDFVADRYMMNGKLGRISDLWQEHEWAKRVIPGKGLYVGDGHRISIPR